MDKKQSIREIQQKMNQLIYLSICELSLKSEEWLNAPVFKDEEYLDMLSRLTDDVIFHMRMRNALKIE